MASSSGCMEARILREAWWMWICSSRKCSPCCRSWNAGSSAKRVRKLIRTIATIWWYRISCRFDGTGWCEFVATANEGGRRAMGCREKTTAGTCQAVSKQFGRFAKQESCVKSGTTTRTTKQKKFFSQILLFRLCKKLLGLKLNLKTELLRTLWSGFKNWRMNWKLKHYWLKNREDALLRLCWSETILLSRCAESKNRRRSKWGNFLLFFFFFFLIHIQKGDGDRRQSVGGHVISASVHATSHAPRLLETRAASHAHFGAWQHQSSTTTAKDERKIVERVVALERKIKVWWKKKNHDVVVSKKIIGNELSSWTISAIVSYGAAANRDFRKGEHGITRATRIPERPWFAHGAVLLFESVNQVVSVVQG